MHSLNILYAVFLKNTTASGQLGPRTQRYYPPCTLRGERQYGRTFEGSWLQNPAGQILPVPLYAWTLPDMFSARRASSAQDLPEILLTKYMPLWYNYPVKYFFCCGAAPLRKSGPTDGSEGLIWLRRRVYAPSACHLSLVEMAILYCYSTRLGISGQAMLFGLGGLCYLLK